MDSWVAQTLLPLAINSKVSRDFLGALKDYYLFFSTRERPPERIQWYFLLCDSNCDFHIKKNELLPLSVAQDCKSTQKQRRGWGDMDISAWRVSEGLSSKWKMMHGVTDGWIAEDGQQNPHQCLMVSQSHSTSSTFLSLLPVTRGPQVWGQRVPGQWGGHSPSCTLEFPCQTEQIHTLDSEADNYMDLYFGFIYK